MRSTPIVSKSSQALLASLALSILPSFTAFSQDQAAKHSAIEPIARSGKQHERHIKFNQAVKERIGDVDLIFVGDSITQGWEGRGKDIWEQYYSKRKALNLGIGGDRTQHVLWRLDNGNLYGISPKAAVVMIGTNNSADDRNTASEMTDGVAAVVKKLREKVPETQILLLGIFPRGETFNNQRGKILQVNQAVRKLAKDKKVHYMDIGHSFVRADGSISKKIMPDFLHLSEKGYELWAKRIEKKLAKLLGENAEKKDLLSGDWSWSILGPDERPVVGRLTLKFDGSKLSGEILMGEGERRFELEEGSFEDNKLAFTVRRKRSEGGEMVYKLTGTLEGDAIKGNVSTELEGQKIDRDWSAERKKE